MTEKQRDDALVDAYRRASASDANRPGAATRTAILAEAAAAARRNSPAANEPRYWPRAVASIAVLGIGVLLWKQTNQHLHLPDAAPVVVSAPVTQDLKAATQPEILAPESLTKAERVPLPERARESARTAEGAVGAASGTAIAPAPEATAAVRELPPQPFPASAAEGPRVVVVAAPAAPPPAAAPAAPAPPAPPLVVQNKSESESDELAEVVTTGTRAQGSMSERAGVVAESAAQPRVGGGMPAAGGAPAGAGAPRAGGAPPGGAGPRGAARAGGAGPGGGAGFGGGGGARGGGTGPGGAAAAARAQDSTALLRQYFPAQYQSEASHSVWLVLNAAGEVLQRGELAPGQSRADLEPQLARALGNRVLGPWQVQSLRNERGQLIELAIARLP